MKTAWDNSLDQQLTNPAILHAYEKETKLFFTGMQLTSTRDRKGMRQAEQPGKSA
jgi:hypothetical protein